MRAFLAVNLDEKMRESCRGAGKVKSTSGIRWVKPELFTSHPKISWGYQGRGAYIEQHLEKAAREVAAFHLIFNRSVPFPVCATCHLDWDVTEPLNWCFSQQIENIFKSTANFQSAQIRLKTQPLLFTLP